ncbi:hypothetical protein [Roseovarius aestuarii]|uniref:Uncharacterized protein n=1 Tax=Roseovarius aestuarii TaxID=475083 RepID=A0A1X7BLA1_9RHOB|nr:hypothetical protein [Roseovarius aestuarii]SMC10314.1 hypothetical protein ROA7745_00120 [Roseovarius aestuarii]
MKLTSVALSAALIAGSASGETYLCTATEAVGIDISETGMEPSSFKLEPDQVIYSADDGSEFEYAIRDIGEEGGSYCKPQGQTLLCGDVVNGMTWVSLHTLAFQTTIFTGSVIGVPSDAVIKVGTCQKL